jgi:hypothetical protein
MKDLAKSWAPKGSRPLQKMRNAVEVASSLQKFTKKDLDLVNKLIPGEDEVMVGLDPGKLLDSTLTLEIFKDY